MSITLKASIASPGIAIGRVFTAEDNSDLSFSTELIDDRQAEYEIDKYIKAVEDSKKQLTGIAERTRKNLGNETADIFKVHMSILKDTFLDENVTEKIINQKKSAAFAVNETFELMIRSLKRSQSNVLAEKIDDINDVYKRLIKNIKGIKNLDFEQLREKKIAVGPKLSPSDIAAVNLENVLAIVMETGGVTSHVSIMARSLGIPMLIGVSNFCSMVKDEDVIVVDAVKGFVVIRPSRETLVEYEARGRQYLEMRNEYQKYVESQAITTDGRRVKALANIGVINEMDEANKNGMDGIGLYRTEFLYMENTNFPLEEEQYKYYKNITEKAAGKKICIRTLDIGGDKPLPYYDMKKQENPFLGTRGIRVSFDMINIFKTQIRAIMRAALHGDISIMFPMISTVNELKKCMEIVEECKKELDASKKMYGKRVKIGMMVETPSAVMMMDKFAKIADFFSIGTNDLTQYVLAMDRSNSSLSAKCSTFDPAVLRCIKLVCEHAHKENKTVSICGEFAGDKKAEVILIGLGVDEFSVSPSLIGKTKQWISNVSYKKALELAQKAINFDTAEQVESFIDKNSR